MSIEVVPDLCAISVAFTEEHLVVEIEDGRCILVPIWWYPRLLNATSEQRQGWSLIAEGIGIHWEEIDENISIRELLSERLKSVPRKSPP
jgi:hypothetical protein